MAQYNGQNAVTPMLFPVLCVLHPTTPKHVLNRHHRSLHHRLFHERPSCSLPSSSPIDNNERTYLLTTTFSFHDDDDDDDDTNNFDGQYDYGHIDNWPPPVSKVDCYLCLCVWDNCVFLQFFLFLCFSHECQTSIWYRYASCRFKLVRHLVCSKVR